MDSFFELYQSIQHIVAFLYMLHHSHNRECPDKTIAVFFELLCLFFQFMHIADHGRLR